MKVDIKPEWMEVLSNAPTQQRLEIIGAIAVFQLTGEIPEVSSRSMPIFSVLMMDVKKHLKRVEINRANGLKPKRNHNQPKVTPGAVVEQEVEDTVLFAIDPEEEAKAEARRIARLEKEKKLEEDIQDIYGAYPTRDPKSGRSLGKCSRDKIRIKALLKERSKEDIMNAIKAYIEDSNANDTFLKNFSTLLNNLPEPVSAEESLPWEEPCLGPGFYTVQPKRIADGCDVRQRPDGWLVFKTKQIV